MRPSVVSTAVVLLSTTSIPVTAHWVTIWAPLRTAFSANAIVAENGQTIAAVGAHNAPATSGERLGSWASTSSRPHKARPVNPFSMPRRRSPSSVSRCASSSATTRDPTLRRGIPSSSLICLIEMRSAHVQARFPGAGLIVEPGVQDPAVGLRRAHRDVGRAFEQDDGQGIAGQFARNRAPDDAAANHDDIRLFWKSSHGDALNHASSFSIPAGDASRRRTACNEAKSTLARRLLSILVSILSFFNHFENKIANYENEHRKLLTLSGGGQETRPRHGRTELGAVRHHAPDNSKTGDPRLISFSAAQPIPRVLRRRFVRAQLRPRLVSLLGAPLEALRDHGLLISFDIRDVFAKPSGSFRINCTNR